MRRAVLVVGLTAALAGLGAGAAQAKLSPTEEKWAKPAISVWNDQNAALNVVIRVAAAKDALVPGTANGNKLRLVLNTFVVCGPLLKKAGAPPTLRLKAFSTALGTACTHDSAGAHDFAKAVGAFTQGKGKLGTSYINQGIAAFKLGGMALASARKSLIAIGGKSIFIA